MSRLTRSHLLYFLHSFIYLLQCSVAFRCGVTATGVCSRSGFKEKGKDMSVPEGSVLQEDLRGSSTGYKSHSNNAFVGGGGGLFEAFTGHTHGLMVHRSCLYRQTLTAYVLFGLNST
jgi:hypothetical protein